MEIGDARLRRRRRARPGLRRRRRADLPSARPRRGHPHARASRSHQPFVPWPVRAQLDLHGRPRPSPTSTITGPTRPAVRGAPVTLTGRVNEAAHGDGGRRAGGGRRRTAPSRSPSPSPARRRVTVRAVDRAGNSRGVRTDDPARARAPAHGPTRAVHMTAISWETDFLREPVLAMLRAGEINTIELDLKDESGVVGYDSKVPLANEDRRGAARATSSSEAVKQIHDLGGRVIGRIVAFRDPVLAALRLGQRRPRAGDPGPGRQRRTRATAASRTSPTRWCASTTSTSRPRPPRPAWTTSSTTTSAGPTARSTRWSSPA